MYEVIRFEDDSLRRWPMLPASSAILVYVFGVILALGFYAIFDGEFWVVVLHLASSASFYLLWRRGYWGEARFDSYGAVVLLGAVGYRVVAIVDTLVNGIGIETWPPGVYAAEPWSVIVRGEILTQLSIFLVVISWHWAIAREPVQIGFLGKDGKRSNAAAAGWVLYWIGVALQFGRYVFGMDYGAAEQIVRVFDLGAVAAIVLIANSGSQGRAKLWLAFGLALPLSIAAVGSGMKENIIIPFVPPVLVLWIAFPSAKARAGMIVGGFLIMGLLQTFVAFARPLWWGETNERASVQATVEMFRSGTSQQNIMQGMTGMFERLNTTNPHAWSVAIVDQSGNDPEEVFGPILYMFIPRFLWAEKPLAAPGANQTRRLLGLRPGEEVTTSTAAGFGGELYIGGSWVGVVLGSIVLGLFLARIQHILASNGSGTGLSIYNMTLLLAALRFDEIHLLTFITGSVVLVSGLLIIDLVLGSFGQRRGDNGMAN
jgi:hypothetical protein